MTSIQNSPAGKLELLKLPSESGQQSPAGKLELLKLPQESGQQSQAGTVELRKISTSTSRRVTHIDVRTKDGNVPVRFYQGCINKDGTLGKRLIAFDPKADLTGYLPENYNIQIPESHLTVEKIIKLVAKKQNTGTLCNFSRKHITFSSRTLQKSFLRCPGDAKSTGLTRIKESIINIFTTKEDKIRYVALKALEKYLQEQANNSSQEPSTEADSIHPGATLDIDRNQKAFNFGPHMSSSKISEVSPSLSINDCTGKFKPNSHNYGESNNCAIKSAIIEIAASQELRRIINNGDDGSEIQQLLRKVINDLDDNSTHADAMPIRLWLMKETKDLSKQVRIHVAQNVSHAHVVSKIKEKLFENTNLPKNMHTQTTWIGEQVTESEKSSLLITPMHISMAGSPFSKIDQIFASELQYGKLIGNIDNSEIVEQNYIFTPDEEQNPPSINLTLSSTQSYQDSQYVVEKEYDFNDGEVLIPQKHWSDNRARKYEITGFSYFINEKSYKHYAYIIKKEKHWYLLDSTKKQIIKPERINEFFKKAVDVHLDFHSFSTENEEQLLLSDMQSTLKKYEKAKL